jgi:hypothetical protein
MKYRALVTILFSLFFTTVLLACPMCGGELEGSSNRSYMVYILGAFVLLTYIPFYMLYKTVYKYRNINKIPEETTEKNDN